MRLFVSVDLPETLADAVAAIQAEFEGAAGLRFTDPTQAHLTLKFLGEVAESRRPELAATLERAVADAGVAPFDATLGGLGVFPSMEYVRVVWLGVREGSAELTGLRDAVESAFVDAGFDPADHAFTPHVTLARMEHAGGKERVRRTVRERDPTAGTMRVSEVRLTESVLTDEGPSYATVHRAALAGRSGRTG